MGHQRLLQTRFSYYVSLRLEFRALMTVTISAYKTMIDSSLDRVICLIYIIYVCLRVVLSNTYSAVFLFCLSSSCVPYVASFFGLSNLISPFVFWNVFSAFGTAAISHFCQKIMHKFLITPLSSYQQFCDLVPKQRVRV